VSIFIIIVASAAILLGLGISAIGVIGAVNVEWYPMMQSGNYTPETIIGNMAIPLLITGVGAFVMTSGIILMYLVYTHNRN
jgi:hypothetical protein